MRERATFFFKKQMKIMYIDVLKRGVKGDALLFKRAVSVSQMCNKVCIDIWKMHVKVKRSIDITAI